MAQTGIPAFNGSGHLSALKKPTYEGWPPHHSSFPIQPFQISCPPVASI